mmetsp:Transcript_24780/g.58792  ORF Transcript_24780/g.58792 Transcript_24780/m.58792 type:complete len:124 (-) Transcript_24780:37-408(-)
MACHFHTSIDASRATWTSSGRSDLVVFRASGEWLRSHYAKFRDSGPKSTQYSKSACRGSDILDRTRSILPVDVSLGDAGGNNFDSTCSINCDCYYFTQRRDDSVGENELCKELFHASRMQLPA